MTKKDFSAALNAGVKRDQTMREASAPSRFDRVDEALSGRSSLLAPAKETVVSPTPSDAEAYLANLEQSGKVRSRYITMPISHIDDNPLNSRTIYKEELIAARAASMARDGQLVPVLAGRHPDFADRAILIDGQFRKLGALRNRAETLDVKLLEGLDPIDFYRLARAANNEREQETVLDVALGYKKLLDQGHAKSNDELAVLVEEGKSKVSKILSLLELPQSVLDVIAAQPKQFGLSTSYELTLYLKATDDKRTLAFAERIRDEELPFQKVKAIRESLENGRAPRKSLSRQYKVSTDDGAEIGAIKEWGDGKVRVDLVLGSAEKAEAYVVAFKKLLADDGHQLK
ncbi:MULTISPECIES: ParB/RepB/Spo0J family partition protein [unclassified Burkholderia]|uniref:ParB/RepB/Spo0J family partition protein n=1 Tax=unclassified Burkholderia TaxID=2613784 RepID=UPI0007549175|nr:MULTISPECIES: ParB/RepB/Spo0J family partition protein [unclassified Burkholderia]KUY50316.1 chromosome partitioning protein ParB [Burkholderia sp. RF2-non_BP3]KUY77594.1 chromosome partitioning protein ParB [Burkholderia sp. RF4-BP95]KUY92993.1 chromosome partitioning protein ParB [Burkholderia sp. RF7-non_BP1]KUY93092.1 chromosome partitioning protein ParB [Burkholderia sp. RF7-non_BP4]